MASVLVRLFDVERNRVKALKQTTGSAVEAQRYRFQLRLDEGMRPGAVQWMAECVRSTVDATVYRYERGGVDRLYDARRSPVANLPSPALC